MGGRWRVWLRSGVRWLGQVWLAAGLSLLLSLSTTLASPTAIPLPAAPWGAPAPAASRALQMARPGAVPSVSQNLVHDTGLWSEFSNSPRTPFYLAEKAGRRLWLLGTMHVGRAEWYPLRQIIMQALAESSVYMTEIGPTAPTAMAQIMTTYAACNSPCLFERLQPRTRALLKRYYQPRPDLLGSLAMQRPWRVSMTIDGERTVEADLDPAFGVENVLEEYLAGKQYLALEAADTVPGLMAGLDATTEDEMLYDTLRDSDDKVSRQARTYATLWQVGDADSMYAELQRTLAETGLTHAARFITDKMLSGRNRQFVATMQHHANPNMPVFVAMGALHLGGPQGVLQLLRQQGWHVEPR